METVQREKVQFASGGVDCVGWHYPGTNGACVVMAAGGAVTKEPGCNRFASGFQAEGFTVLAFDYRHLGESGGKPRQVVRTREQLADWNQAISFAADLPNVDRNLIAVWGFSLSGGHVFRVAAKNKVAAAIAQSPLVDGMAATPNALRHETLSVIVRFPFLAGLDVLRGLLGSKPLLVPLAGPRGTVAMLTTPDAQDADHALNPDNCYPEWQQSIAARSVVRLTWYRPGRAASKINCPLLVIVCDNDQSALAPPAIRAASRARTAELIHLTGGHYAPFLDEHDKAIEAELDFLRRTLL